MNRRALPALLLTTACGRIAFEQLDEEPPPDDADIILTGQRFYPHESTSAPVLVARDPTWGTPCAAHAQRFIDLVPSGEPPTLIAGCFGDGLDSNDQLFRTYVSAPLRPQILGGSGQTVAGSFSVREGDASLNARPQVVVKVVSGDGSLVRGVLFGPDVAPLTNEFNASPVAYRRSFPRGGPAETSAVTVEDGDRLVFEVGYRIHSTSTSNRGFFELRGDATTDLPVSGSSNALNPWVQLSDLVQF